MRKIPRREFITTSGKFLAAVPLAGAVGTIAGAEGRAADRLGQTPPNILLLLADQMQTPPEGYGPDEGMAEGLKEIFGFRPLSPQNAYSRFFPGLLRLREHAIVLARHHTASSACCPSRACIMTGQYSNVTGVTETDGLCKSADDIPFLDPDGVPTIGDWFRALGYTTHYFGKWHVSKATPETNYLEPWGFSDWASSYPEAHGIDITNAAAYRDPGCADDVVAFLEKKGKDPSTTPWLAVGSLLDPHDCSLYPLSWDGGIAPWIPFPPPPSLPAVGTKSIERTVQAGTDNERLVTVDLNPDGFPQNNSRLPPTYAETLDEKPGCQKDYSLKFGLMFASNGDYWLIKANSQVRSPLPFQLRGEWASAWSLGYSQFYPYSHYLMDLQLRRMLKALDDSGLADNTIIVFLSDHGEMAGAHGGMTQKFHTAYEEMVRVPMVVSSPLVNKSKKTIREIWEPTSSIDLAPTLLGLAGYDPEEVQNTMKRIHGQSPVLPFPGADLSPLLKGERSGTVVGSNGTPRTGVLFVTSDTATEKGEHPTEDQQKQYELFLEYVNDAIAKGYLPEDSQGPVRQPNSVHALCTGDWKIVRYFDPHNVEPDEWELYCLITDPIERTNLVDFRTGDVRDDVTVPGLTARELRRKNKELRRELARQEEIILG